MSRFDHNLQLFIEFNGRHSSMPLMNGKCDIRGPHIHFVSIISDRKHVYSVDETSLTPIPEREALRAE